jgi:hypothetical protein
MGVANALAPVVLQMGQGDGSGATLDLNGFSQTVTGLVFSSSGGTKAITSPTAATLTVSNGGDYAYGGLIAGAILLVKREAGVLSLAGANTSTGRRPGGRRRTAHPGERPAGEQSREPHQHRSPARG